MEEQQGLRGKHFPQPGPSLLPTFLEPVRAEPSSITQDALLAVAQKLQSSAAFISIITVISLMSSLCWTLMR